MSFIQNRCNSVLKIGAACLWILGLLVFASCTVKAPEVPVVKPLVVEAPEVTPENRALTLGPDDKISITVWRNTELNSSLTIGPSGTISMPMAGDINVSGMTCTGVARELEKRLSKFIKKPAVSVNVVSIASQKVHVMGQVRSPGTFSYMERMAAWEAVSKAGGFTEDANSKRLLLVRVKKQEATISVLPMDFEKIFKDGKIAGNYYLENGDVLYVAEKKISSVERFMVRLNNVIMPILSLQRMISITPNVIDALEGDNASNIVLP